MGSRSHIFDRILTLFFWAITSAVFAGGCSTGNAPADSTADVITAETNSETNAGDPDFRVTINKSDRTWPGTTLIPVKYDPESPGVIEIDMAGHVIWEYRLPADLKQYTNPGFDAELLPNDEVLLVLPKKGIFQIDRSGKIVWSHLDTQVSHDADRLANGNTLVVFGNEDTQADAQIKEIDNNGALVWSWYAKADFDQEPHASIYIQGWTHTNAVVRMKNGNTLISMRNFNLLAEVDPNGTLVKTIGADFLKDPHDPEVLENGNILVANHADPGEPHSALEIDVNSGKIVWEFIVSDVTNTPVRDADRLPNGNTLITGSHTILEVTRDKEIVWQFSLKSGTIQQGQGAARGFYKAQRLATTSP